MSFKLLPNQFPLTLALLTPTILIAYTSYRLAKDFSTPFTWHPILETIGYFLFMLGILQFRRKDIPQQTRVRYHWVCEVIAIFFLIYANKTAYDAKEANNKQHFASWHSTFGLITGLFSYLVLIGGSLALYSESLKKIVKPRTVKWIHRVGGSFVFCLSTGVVLFGLFTRWFQENVAVNFWFFCVVGVGVSGLYVVYKPVSTIFKK